MTPAEFQEARRKLGFSVREMSKALACSEIHVRRMETAPEKTSHRPVNGTTERLVEALLSGWRSTSAS